MEKNMMTEHEALAKLGAKDWRSLNKGQIMSFLFETAPNLSDEVRLKILELAPDILNTANTVLSEYQDTAKKTIEGNQQVVDKILDHNHDMSGAIFFSFNKAMDVLKTLLADPNASFEEKQYWNGELFKCLHEMREYDKDNKVFLSTLDNKNKMFFQNILKYGGVATIVVGGVVVAALTGSKFKFPGKG